MLLIASETLRGSSTVNDLVREMSLSLSFYSTAGQLDERLTGTSRRIVLLTTTEIREDIVDSLVPAAERTPMGLLIAADRSSLRSTDSANLITRLTELPNLEWVGDEFDFERLAASARRVRRRMLKVSEDDLIRAFENFEFVVRYQPKVAKEPGADWVTKEAEALIRWQHPEHGLIGPLEFLPEVEEFGMMSQLTEFVLRKAAAQLGSWQEKKLVLDGCVNLAPSLLRDPSIAERYAQITRELGIAPERFTFEVVEQDLANPDAPHQQTLINLRKQGFRLCLDDFRVAAVSLSTFEKLPFDEIKIHVSALKHAQKDKVAVHVLAAVSGLAHNLGMSVCAEGVEDQETFEFLQLIKCDKMQGFMISEAVLPHIIQRVYSANAANEAVA